MGYATEPSTHTAKQRHRCDWCWQFIEPSEQYKRYRFFSYGEAGTCKMHPECFDAMQEEANEEGGFFEWTPGRDRPAAQKGGV